MATLHTPGPWEVVTERLHPGETSGADNRVADSRWDERTTLRETVIVGDGADIATVCQHDGSVATPRQADANADLIVRAVNAHDGMLAAFKRAVAIIENRHYLSVDFEKSRQRRVDKFNAVIAAAEVDEGVVVKADCRPVGPVGRALNNGPEFCCESDGCDDEPAYAFGIGGGWAYVCEAHYQALPGAGGEGR